MPTDRELFDQGKRDELFAQVLRRAERDVRDICGRLVGMGDCINTCPDACAEFSEIGHRLAISATQKALKSAQWGDKGILFITIPDDDFRRGWNSTRDLTQELLQNKFLRLGRITTYGTQFYSHAQDHELLKTFGNSEAEACRIFQSWLGNLWDDACDNADMLLSVANHSREVTYCHPSRIPDGKFRRYGYRADRVHRRRTSRPNEREVDALLPPEWRPLGRLDGVEESRQNAAYREQLVGFVAICDALFNIVEKTDEHKERFGAFPNQDDADILEMKLTKRDISFRVKGGEYEVSMDDVDRNDDGFVNASVFSDGSTPNNRYTLFDDFVEAWVLTRGAHRKGETQHSVHLTDDESDSVYDDHHGHEKMPEQYITVDESPIDKSEE